MQAKLEQARARLAQAQAELETGRADLSEQKDAVTEVVTSIYQGEDPHLQALNSMMNAEDPADLTWAEEGRDVVVLQETRAYDELRASEVLLEVREEQVADAEQQVEVQRQAAAEHLVETQELTQQARAARARVRETVNARRDAKNVAAAARARDLREVQELKRQEAKVKALILARARRAAQSSSGGYTGSTGSFLGWPVPGGYVTSPFGYRTHPIYGYYSLHDGTDIGKGCGAPLAAAASGRVISRTWSSVYGNRLYISVGTVNGKNVTIVYNHAAGYNVGVGATVSRGQIIGSMGTTGWSTACHLHFTVLVNGQPVNPMNWM
jgi:murein DD-endopeptidase MepM/ murein hydrolase activator NlpD